MSEQRSQDESYDWAIAGMVDGSLKGDQLASRINMLAKNHVLAAEPVIAALLHDDDYLVRERALTALIRYFRLDAYWEDARRMMLEDEINSATGAALLGEIKDNTRDPVTLGVLSQVVLDPEQPAATRREAYIATRVVRDYNPVEQFEMHFQTDGLVDLPVEWEMLKKYLSTPEVIAYTQQAIQQIEHETLSVQDMYSLLLRMSIARYQPAAPTLARYLAHPNGGLRGAALLGLIRYLRLQSHVDTARQMLLNDPDDDVRVIAAKVLGEFYQNTQNPSILHDLATIAADPNRAEAPRRWAYMAMERIRAFDRSDWEGWLATDEPTRYFDQGFIQQSLASQEFGNPPR